MGLKEGTVSHVSFQHRDTCCSHSGVNDFSGHDSASLSFSVSVQRIR